MAYKREGLFGSVEITDGPMWTWPKETPYRCPICDGHGTMPGDFYADTRLTVAAPLFEGCRTCKGEGIVWR